jgi:hypothetical protein
MLARVFFAALIGGVTYVGALLVERVSSATATKIEVATSDPWEKLKQELAVRRQISLLRKTEGGSHSLAHNSNSTAARTSATIGASLPDRLQVDSEKTRIVVTGAEGRPSPWGESNLPDLLLVNPNLAESAKEKVADLAPSSRVPTEAIANDRVKTLAEKSKPRKRSIITRQDDGSSHGGRADSGHDPLASRPLPSRDSPSSRYEQSVRDYRDLRNYMLR